MLKAERPDRPYWQIPVSIPRAKCLDGCGEFDTEAEYSAHAALHPLHRVVRA